MYCVLAENMHITKHTKIVRVKSMLNRKLNILGQNIKFV
jgi:hypothetical protein